VQGCAWFFWWVLKLEEWGRGKRRGDGGDRRSSKGVTAEESGVGVRSAHSQVEEEGGPGHDARSSWGAQTRAACGRAAVARGRQHRVTHGGGRGRERRERAVGLAYGPVCGVRPSYKRERERMASGPDCNSNKI
jgi:hypothetical protein